MAGITTHVLNTITGKPGTNVRIDFSKRQGDGTWQLVKTVRTNADGRTDGMILKPEDTQVGEYELLFHVDEFFLAEGMKLADPPFIEKVPVRFSVFDAKQHFHVPMLMTPGSCATYRGS